jgi:LysR family transcriptional regulator, transcriptional activator of nhaA
VLAGQGASANPNLRLASDRLVSSQVDWYGPQALLQDADRAEFPQSLQRLPVLLPTGHSVLRARLDRWFLELGLQPQVVGEFEDSALMTVFAARGMGVFPVSRLGAGDVGLMSGLSLLGQCPDVHEEIHAIRNRRGQHHPLVRKVLASFKPAQE